MNLINSDKKSKEGIITLKKKIKSYKPAVHISTGKRVAIMFVLVAMLLALAACSGSLSQPKNGIYKSSEGILSQTWTFSGTDSVTLSAGGGLISTNGTYTINGTRLAITSALFGIENTTGYTITEITSNSFLIDGTKFIKQ